MLTLFLSFRLVSGVNVSAWMQQWTLSPNYPIVDASVKVVKLPNGTSLASILLKQQPITAARNGTGQSGGIPAGNSGWACDESLTSERWWVPVAYRRQVGSGGGSGSPASPLKWDHMNSSSCTTTIPLGAFGGEAVGSGAGGLILRRDSFILSQRRFCFAYFGG